MNCLILDDEPMAAGLIAEYVSYIPYLSLVKKCSSAFEAYEAMRSSRVDLIFLDIHMPTINGIHFLAGLNEKPIVIFTTAFTEYAVEAFACNAVDYLLKPISFERFFAAVTKASELYALRNRKTTGPQLSTENVSAEESKRYILVKADYKLVKINVADILYVEGLKDYVKIYLQSSPKPVITHNTLKKMSECLPEDSFIRIHRSFIVSMGRIQSVTKHQVIFTGKSIPIGENYKELFFQRFENIPA